jgi:hypothetical protein
MTCIPDEDRVVEEVRSHLGDRGRGAGGPARTQVVVVDGPSGAGKTRLGRRLAHELPATLVHMDDIYPGWDGLDEAVTILGRDVVGPLVRGEPAAYRRWDWDDDRWGERVVVDPAGIVVVEGSGSSAGAAGRLADVRVWVMTRDGEVYRPHWDRWAEQEQALFAAERLRDRADIVWVTSVDDDRSGPST